MGKISMVPIQKMDVLMEDFSNIQELIEITAADREQLLEARNSWEVCFMGYDDDPREIPEIPEVVNWIIQSAEAGIPWFYFLRSPEESCILSVFLSCFGFRDPECPNRFLFEPEKIMPFVKKNQDNLAKFVEKYDIAEEEGCAAADIMLNYISAVLGEDLDEDTSEKPIDPAERKKLIKEALERLEMLEKIYGLNPKVRKYFKEGKLYYSYLTGGGYIGSIDTINYDVRYAAIAEAFEEQKSCLVYHVVEQESTNTISLLFVSRNYDNWLEERPALAGVMAQVVDLDTYEMERGFIKLDCFQGALYRRDTKVYSSLPDIAEDSANLTDEDSEIIERLEILKNTGIVTDLDFVKVYEQEKEICCSLYQLILGYPVGVVNRISANSEYAEFAKEVSKLISSTVYFLIGSTGKELAFLFLSKDPKEWESEKLMLSKKKPMAVVVDPENNTARFERIEFQIVNGGPLF